MGEMAATRAGSGRAKGCSFAEGRPLRRSGRPVFSLKSERMSSERGSPGRTQPRPVRSIAPLGDS